MNLEFLNVYNLKEAHDYSSSREDKITRRLLENALGGLIVMMLSGGEKAKPDYQFDALVYMKALEYFLYRREALIEVLSGGRIDAMNDFPDEL